MKNELFADCHNFPEIIKGYIILYYLGNESNNGIDIIFELINHAFNQLEG